MDTSQLQRCEQLWFHDGSIVLQAGSMLFRVHQTILALQSPFFAQLFEVPQPPQVETYEGCPLVVLYDTEEDARIFLLALSDRRYPRSFGDEHVTATLLHMSSKYQAHGLRSQILEYLRPYFPTTLDGWWAKKRKSGERNPFSRRSTVIALANAAEHAAPHLLPAAFLLLNRYYESLEQSWYIGKLGGKPVVLHASLKDTFLRGREKLDILARTTVYSRIFLYQRGDSDRTWYDLKCQPGVLATMEKLKGYRSGCIINPFEFSKDNPAWSPSLLCSSCLANLEHDYRVGTRQLWKQLPEVFGLPNWDVLQKQAE